MTRWLRSIEFIFLAVMGRPEDRELDYWAMSCLPGTTSGRLSAVNMRSMEVFVLHPSWDDDDEVSAFVVLDGAKLPSRSDHPGIEFDRSGYRDAPSTQLRALGGTENMLAALRDERFAIACKALADELMAGGRTMQWRGHNFQLADAVLGRNPAAHG